MMQNSWNCISNVITFLLQHNSPKCVGASGLHLFSDWNSKAFLVVSHLSHSQHPFISLKFTCSSCCLSGSTFHCGLVFQFCICACDSCGKRILACCTLRCFLLVIISWHDGLIIDLALCFLLFKWGLRLAMHFLIFNVMGPVFHCTVFLLF